jgi:ribosomal protein S27E
MAEYIFFSYILWVIKTPVKGKYMGQKCTKCGTPVSKKWLLFGFSSTNYRCAKCSAILTWTGRRLLVNLLIAFTFGLPLLFIKKWNIDYFDIAPVLVITAIILLLYFPGQFRNAGK